VSQWFEDASDVANNVARNVHRKYHTYFDVADVRQELYLWIFKRKDKVQEWLSFEMGTQEYRGGVKQLGKTLTRQADRYCRKMKAQKLGYEMRDEQFYSSATLSELLPYVWEDVVDTIEANKPRVSGGGAPAEGGTYVVQLIDVRKNLHRLQRYDQDILEFKFRDQMSFKDLAEVLDCSDTTAHRKVEGALRRLTHLLGGSNPYGDRDE